MRKTIVLLFSVAAVIAHGQSWKPAKVSLTTIWGEKVTPGNVWNEYPRPQMQRPDWKSLNGMWDYAVLPKGQTSPSIFDGQILVPFCLESSLSGVGKPLLPSQELWYGKTFAVPAAWTGQDIILNFDAVDWETKLWVNGKKVGEHKGGSDPFSFNITPYLNKNGEQKIVMSVWDPTDSGLQPRGKQVLDPKGIWYTAVSGIWQSVWLEPLPKTAVQQFVPTADIDNNRINFKTTASGLKSGAQLHFVIRQDGKVVKDTTASFRENISVTIPSVKLWSPQSPDIYTMTVELRSQGKIADKFDTYFAMRKISLGNDQFGYTRLMLNNKPLFQFGTLDQGWWPDGLLTPPSDEAMLYDMAKLKEMGFNMIRKHIKVEPSRYYYHADTMGMLLWQDMPSGFAGGNTPSHVAADSKEDWVRPAESAKQFETEWRSIMDHLRFFPSIVMWVPLNEGWGQYDTKRIAALTKNYDPSRLVDAPSGWTDRGVGDVYDAHQYPGPGMQPPSQNKGRAIVLGEFGGLGLVIKDHIWDPNKRNWGYKTYLERDQLISEYTEMMYNLQLTVPRGLAAAIYTQTTDVEGEVNGLMTYDRRVMKMPVDLISKLHVSVYKEPEGRITFINKENETAPSKFKKSRSAVEKNWIQGGTDGFTDNSTPEFLKKGDSIYAYQNFDIDDMPEGLGIKLFGFGDAKIYLNGQLIWKEDKIRTRRHYDEINISDKINLLKKGSNRIAVECTDATQDTNFDFALYRLDQ